MLLPEKKVKYIEYVLKLKWIIYLAYLKFVKYYSSLILRDKTSFKGTKKSKL